MSALRALSRLSPIATLALLAACPDDAGGSSVPDVAAADVADVGALDGAGAPDSQAADGAAGPDTQAADGWLPDAGAGDASAGDAGTPDAGADALPDTAPAVAPDVAPDVVPDVAEDADAAPDALLDAAGGADVGPDAAEPGDAEDADAAAPQVVQLAPETLSFFSLPIGSVRYAVSGYDPATKVCATLVWDFSNNGEPTVAHCDDFYQGFPYVILVMDADGPCGAWDYGTDVVTTEASGCVDFADFGPGDLDLVDAVVHVESAAFVGSIRAENLSLADPRPTFFGIEYTTDIPEDVWAQTAGPEGTPTWVSATKDGAPVGLFPLCGVPRCDGGPAPVCGQKDVVTSLTGTSYAGSIYAAWDGRIHALDEANGCQTAAVAPDGAYEATMCFGWQVEATPTGQAVKAPQCHTVPFTVPSETVVWHADFGG